MIFVHRTVWFLLCAMVFIAPAGARAQVVISQVFGGGGNSGAQFTHDFVELFNRGDASVDVTGWSLQFGSATGTTSLGATAAGFTLLSGLILPGQYYLVRGVSGGTVGSPLPVPDITDATPPSIAAASGKVALVRNSVPLGTTCPVGAAFVTVVADFVGFGSSNCWEGFSAAATGSNTRAVVRLGDGCTDTGDNAADFIAAIPNPRNSASDLRSCPASSPGHRPGVVPEPRSLLLLLGSLPFVILITRRRSNPMC